MKKYQILMAQAAVIEVTLPETPRVGDAVSTLHRRYAKAAKKLIEIEIVQVCYIDGDDRILLLGKEKPDQ